MSGGEPARALRLGMCRGALLTFWVGAGNIRGSLASDVYHYRLRGKSILYVQPVMK